MKKGFGLVRVFFIGVLAIGLFGLLSFVIAQANTNPGHGGIDICDNFLCVTLDADSGWGGSPLVGIGTMNPDSGIHVNVSGKESLFKLERIDSINGGYLQFLKGIYGGFVINTGESSSNLSFGDDDKTLDILLSGNLVFSNGSVQTTASFTNCDFENSISFGTSVVYCSPGKTRTGGGCHGNLISYHSYPIPPNGWKCEVSPTSFQVEAYAVCCS